MIILVLLILALRHGPRGRALVDGNYGKYTIPSSHNLNLQGLRMYREFRLADCTRYCRILSISSLHVEGNLDPHTKTRSPQPYALNSQP